jgi:1-acyl-sn-glycerol-3-phosphate acyltransferase
VPYAAWATLSFTLLALVTLVILMLLPRLEQRRSLVHGTARLGLRLAGLSVALQHAERLPAGPCVVVANHASYLDGVVMKALLPARFAFVIKREMNEVPLAGLLLRRIGSEFVHRGQGGKGARDALRVLRTASRGRSLVFFPEGTFGEQPGLLRFHPGAFVTAARAGLPVVPVVIRGTREALPPGGFLPYPATVTVEVLDVLPPTDAADAAVRLRQQARERILARLGEPDLAAAEPATTDHDSPGPGP